ncbi:MAG: energy transducer TonB [Opitutales bacterium]
MHQQDSKRAWIISASIHGAVFSAVGLTALAGWLIPEEPEPFVFEMVATADAREPTALPEPQPIVPMPARAQPLPEPAPPIEPRREPPAVQPRLIEPTPAPVPARETTVKRVQYDPDRYAPTPRRAQPAPAPAPAPPVPQLSQSIRSMTQDMERRLTSTRQTSSPSTPMVSAGQLARFQSAVQASVQVQWSRQQLASGSDRLEAEVTFSLAPNGQQANVFVSRSSGDVAFDRAATQAVTRAKMPPTPDGEAYTLTIPVVQVAPGLQ